MGERSHVVKWISTKVLSFRRRCCAQLGGRNRIWAAALDPVGPDNQQNCSLVAILCLESLAHKCSCSRRKTLLFTVTFLHFSRYSEIVIDALKHLQDHHIIIIKVCHPTYGSKQPTGVLRGLSFEMAAPECEQQREKNTSGSWCNLSSLWHLSTLFLTSGQSENKFQKQDTHTYIYTNRYIYGMLLLCCFMNVSSRLQISNFFNCCHNEIYLSKQISRELLMLEMWMWTEVKTIYRVQESAGDVVTKKQTKKKIKNK